jgi:bifunctional non-homologous end joining protein LigD
MCQSDRSSLGSFVFVCEVAFQEWMSDGKMRAPNFLGLRDDKEPKELVREN